MAEHQISMTLVKDGRRAGRIFSTAERLARLCAMNVCPADGADCPLGRAGDGCTAASAQEWIAACARKGSRE